MRKGNVGLLFITLPSEFSPLSILTPDQLNQCPLGFKCFLKLPGYSTTEPRLTGLISDISELQVPTPHMEIVHFLYNESKCNRFIIKQGSGGCSSPSSLVDRDCPNVSSFLFCFSSP